MHDALEFGRLADWMAKGKWKSVFKQTGQQRSTELLTHCVGVAEEGRNRIMLEFNRGRDRVWLTLEQKYSFWGVLPHYLCSIADPDHDDARYAASICMDMANQIRSKAQGEAAARALEDVHPLVEEVLGDNALAHDVKDFAAGSAPSAALIEKCTEFSSISVNEISIESKHALGKCRTKSKTRMSSPALFSAELRHP